jgi:hypothetical protein
MEQIAAVCPDAEARPSKTNSEPGLGLTVLFTATVFWASALLFLLEPMFAKMILPVFGGSPAVWNTSMVFFQSTLFLAYVYSHALAGRTAAQSVLIHSLAVFVPLLVLPMNVRAAVNWSTVVTHPSAAVLMIAASSIGLPFFLVATTAPLLQRWFSQTVHRDASDPYFLYAASNAGSLIGLALYPCLLEPGFRTSQQALIWSIGYAVFLVLTLACSLAGYRRRIPNPIPVSSDHAVPHRTEKLLCAALAFVPASLLYGVTAQLSTDFPPIPLLWVIPLALYLLTFIVAFSTRFELFRRTRKVVPTIIVVAMMLFLAGDNPRLWGVAGLLKLGCFALIAVAFHTELARHRPARQYLTEYYLWISAGGILGGVLNSFIAPVTFSDFWEYPLTLLLAAALLPAISFVSRRPVNLKVICSAMAVTCIVGIAMRMGRLPFPPMLRAASLAAGTIVSMRVPLRWTAATLLLISLSLGRGNLQQSLYQGRSFFGRYQVNNEGGGKWHTLVHGTTVHGIERMDDPLLRTKPRSYYRAPKAVFDALSNKPLANIAIVGLGAGTMGCYSRPGQSTTFFEIDPLVEHIASDNRYFTFLSECSGPKNIVLGDARLTLSKAASRSFDLIVLDAFSSDAIPLHLLTTEAFQLYREKLTGDGLLLVHISNNYIKLSPVVAGSGGQAGYTTLLLDDLQLTKAEVDEQRYRPSQWALVLPSGRAREFEAYNWRPFTGERVDWTDDHSSIFRVVTWSKVLGTEFLKIWVKQHVSQSRKS